MQRKAARPGLLSVPTMLGVRYQCSAHGISGSVTAGLDMASRLIGTGSTLQFVWKADKLELQDQWLAEGQNPRPWLHAATWLRKP